MQEALSLCLQEKSQESGLSEWQRKCIKRTRKGLKLIVDCRIHNIWPISRGRVGYTAVKETKTNLPKVTTSS